MRKKILIILILIFLGDSAFSYSAETISKCGTPFKKNLKKKKLLLYSAYYLDLPSDYGLDKSYKKDHFKLWYTTSGTNAVPTADADSDGTPDYIENSANYCEESYTHMVNTLGYLPPPTTNNYPKIYVYFINMSYFGWCDFGEYPDDLSGENTLIAIHKNMSFVPSNDDPEGKVKGALKVTIAHEFFHAVKASYDWDDELWWDEATSTWMEDEVYDNVNDYIRYLSGWFSHPEYPLDKQNGWHEYGSVIFAKYLSENYTTGDTIKEIWIRCAVPQIQAKEAIADELTERGSSFSSAFKDFTVANCLKLYEEGSRYPDIGIKVNSATPYINSSNNSISYLSSNYIVVPSISGNPPALPVFFDGEDNGNFGVMVIGVNSDETYDVWKIPLDNEQKGNKKVENFEKVVLIASNLSLLSNSSYAYITGFGLITSPPSNLLVNYSNGVNTLTWSSAIGDVSGYNVYRSFYQDKNYSLIAQVGNTNSYEDVVAKAKSSGTFYYYYFVTARDSSGFESLPSNKEWIGVSGVESKINNAYNYPNPATSTTKFVCEFTGSAPGIVKIEIYNIQGRKIKEIADYSPNISGNNIYTSDEIAINYLSNGVYLYRIIFDTGVGKISKVGKLAILR